VRRLALVAVAGVVAGCGAQARHAADPAAPPARTAATGGKVAAAVRPAPSRRCSVRVRSVGSARVAYAAFAPRGAVAYIRPDGAVRRRFGAKNANGYPTFFGVVAERLGVDCRTSWYRVELPVRPNGATGWVRASAVQLAAVRTRIDVDLSRRRLTLYEAGRATIHATVAVGSPATPTPTGRYYVDQRLVPEDTSGPFGPGAIGISAFSPVLTGWTQGGPVAIHGTNEPWSIGHAVSNGCIRLPNATLARLFRLAGAGTPVIIHA
jgi:lipoprotein-anchoring transpeptidase ErfK/SrfK